jgi:hypothetical protein
MNWLTRLVSVKVLMQALTTAVLLILANIDGAVLEDAPRWAQIVVTVVVPLLLARQKKETAPPQSAIDSAVRLGLARPLQQPGVPTL